MRFIGVLLFLFGSVYGAYAQNWPSGQWRYAPGFISGNMSITNCQNNECHISLATINGAHTCELDDAILRVDGDHATAIITDEFISDCTITIDKKFSDVIDVQATRGCNALCGMSGYFIGRWENQNRPRTFAAGFDCDLAASKTEHTVCRDYRLAAMDREMNILYRQTPNQKTAQQKWIAARNACGNDITCLVNVYQNRLRDLVAAISGTDFTLYTYAHAVIDDTFFHPRDAILLENYIKEKIGHETYERFSECSDRYSNHHATDDYLFGSYGCPGMFTFMESAAYIDADQIWIAFIDYTGNPGTPDNQRFIAVYGPRSVGLSSAPDVLNNWIQDLQSRIKESCQVVFHDAL